MPPRISLKKNPITSVIIEGRTLEIGKVIDWDKKFVASEKVILLIVQINPFKLSKDFIKKIN